jgi:hypothetical protein
MTKNLILNAILCVGIIFSLSVNSYTQASTADELNAEREMLKAEMKSKDAQKRKAKMEKLDAPQPTGLSSVDELATNSSEMLTATKEINVQVPEMYKRTIGETVDGVTDVTVKKPTLQEVTGLAQSIATQIKAVTDASDAVSAASSEVKSASPVQGLKATKSLNYSKDVLSLIGPELQMNLKVVNNLIATIKSSNNY